MSESYHQYIVLTAEQFAHLHDELGWDIGLPREGPDGLLLADKPGNVPFSDEELAVLRGMDVEIVPGDQIQGCFESHPGWTGGGIED